MFALPGDRGYVEIMTDREASSRDRSKPATKARIMAYFYQADGTTRMNPEPSDIKVTIGTDEKATAVKLALEDVKQAGRYASEPGPYPEGFRGELEARLNGETVKVPILFR
jgi:hypothetical protein